MSKYDPLWDYLREQGDAAAVMTFDEIRDILGFDIDHSFLTFKRELLDYGFVVKKISLKNKTVAFVAA
jgi:hypothetical protein